MPSASTKARSGIDWSGRQFLGQRRVMRRMRKARLRQIRIIALVLLLAGIAALAWDGTSTTCIL